MSPDVHQNPTEEWPELAEFKQRFRAFVAERDWEQFHSPKNLTRGTALKYSKLKPRN